MKQLLCLVWIFAFLSLEPAKAATPKPPATPGAETPKGQECTPAAVQAVAPAAVSAIVPAPAALPLSTPEFIASQGKSLSKAIKENPDTLGKTDEEKVTLLSDLLMATTKELNGDNSDYLNFKVAEKLQNKTEESSFLANFDLALVMPVAGGPGGWGKGKPAVEAQLEAVDADNEKIVNLVRKPQAPRWMVETHVVWFESFDCLGITDKRCPIGPFFALGLGSTEPIPVSAAGYGVLWSFPGKIHKNQRLNIGLGQVYDYSFRQVKPEYTTDEYVKNGKPIKRNTNLYETGRTDDMVMLSFNLGW